MGDWTPVESRPGEPRRLLGDVICVVRLHSL